MKDGIQSENSPSRQARPRHGIHNVFFSLPKQDDNCYTNAASTALLGFCVDVAALLGYAIPAHWSVKAQRPYLPRASKDTKSNGYIFVCGPCYHALLF